MRPRAARRVIQSSLKPPDAVLSLPGAGSWKRSITLALRDYIHSRVRRSMDFGVWERKWKRDTQDLFCLLVFPEICDLHV